MRLFIYVSITFQGTFLNDDKDSTRKNLRNSISDEFIKTFCKIK